MTEVSRVCRICRVEKPLNEFLQYHKPLRDGTPAKVRRLKCKTCYNLHVKNRSIGRVKKDPVATYAQFLLHRARGNQKGEIGCDLDQKWIEERLSPGTCEVTRLPFDFEGTSKSAAYRTNAWAPSLDRIDSAKGYTKDNCQVVVWAYNRAKGDLNAPDFVKLIQALIGLELKSILV